MIALFGILATACSTVEPSIVDSTNRVTATTSNSREATPETTPTAVIDLHSLPAPTGPIPACRIVLEMNHDRDKPYNCTLEIE